MLKSHVECDLFLFDLFTGEPALFFIQKVRSLFLWKLGSAILNGNLSGRSPFVRECDRFFCREKGDRLFCREKCDRLLFTECRSYFLVRLPTAAAKPIDRTYE
ncbi:hypothetical protein [Microcoleus sp. PH2017_28_MFU_U_A]|uniref:hypothetical protein n=1 Tax=Microcoleus sp. PH2017_28_MFU_U_A TaxID=2798838 RepID=UPI001D2EA13A|nr:hypothetical protein [Microcoleus sp. PH2017_28_MFU_U_A]MCC3593488.1 hypothetical protein [Microcoleus sp. PH2017_28_MFU_U_A]